MDVVAGAVGSVVPKLLQLLQDEYKFHKGLKKNVENLSKELKTVHTFLCKVSDVPWDQLDKQVKEWASDIREASYDMEDILDTFLVAVEGHEPTGRSRLKLVMIKMTDLFRKWKARHDIGVAIKDIMERLHEVATRHARYRIDDLAANSAATTSTRDPRLAAMYKEVARLVGIEKPSNDLIAKLKLSACQKKKIVSVFGTGGLDILYELDKIRFAELHTNNRNERQLIDNLREFLMDKSRKKLRYPRRKMEDPQRKRVRSSRLGTKGLMKMCRQISLKPDACTYVRTLYHFKSV